MGAHGGLRPFPAIDPEPPPRLHRLRHPGRRRVLWTTAAATGLTAVIAVAAVLAWPSAGPAHRAVPARFTDRAGLIVFEEQPSGRLGTAAPDGSGAVSLGSLGALQGFDLPEASQDGRYLVTAEAQLVTLGHNGPTSIEDLQGPQPGGTWLSASFADGGKQVAADQCAGALGAPWQALLAPATGTNAGIVLGAVDGADADPVAGDPKSAAVFVVPAAPGGGSQAAFCPELSTPPSGGDAGAVLERPGQAPRTIIGAAAVNRALGSPPGTPLLLSVYPSPDGSMLAITADTFTASSRSSIGILVVTRAGKVVASLAHSAGFPLRWSPDDREIAMGMAFGATNAAVLVWPLGGVARNILLPGHRREYCTQLLWSPDGRQLLYAAQSSVRALTQAQGLQHGWTVVDLPTGQVHDVTAAGQPAAWLPLSGGGR